MQNFNLCFNIFFCASVIGSPAVLAIHFGVDGLKLLCTIVPNNNPLFPFGPMMFYGKMPMDMVRRLNKYVNKKIVFVEVGVADGGSLHMWRSYLGKKARIIGIDLNPIATFVAKVKLTKLSKAQIDQIERDISNDVQFKSLIEDLEIAPTKIVNFKYSKEKKDIEKKIFNLRNNKFDIFENENDYCINNQVQISDKMLNVFIHSLDIKNSGVLEQETVVSLFSTKKTLGGQKMPKLS